MPLMGPGQGGRLPQVEPWDAIGLGTGGHETLEPDAAGSPGRINSDAWLFTFS